MTKVYLAKPRGFCAGVVRAIDTVDIALKHFGTPLYVRKEIVHNQSVVEKFKARGVSFIDYLSEAPAGSRVIFSAHGVSPQIRQEAKKRDLKIIDATCPLVTKVHAEVHRYRKLGFAIVLIGHQDHDEVEGTLGEAPDIIQVVGTVEEVENLVVPDPDRVVALTQTTLSVDESKVMIDALRKKFPNLTTPPKDDICYATQNRQDAVKSLVGKGIDLLLVVGSQNSSNSQRLCEVAKALGVEAHLIDRATEIKEEWVSNKKCIGLTAGASAPEYLVEEVVAMLESLGAISEELNLIEEDVNFALPSEISDLVNDKTPLGSSEKTPLPTAQA
ncbi:MAG: 4-hydroxy-3-methylbut-2-enyl diphosphate reductase [Bdellovibrionales bacterium]|nr:4-hydroxy-3-methylbut-2-enyl diphosphate reductase [Bdellovibrionales bacterium]